MPGKSAAVQTENTGCSRGRDRSAMCQLINCVGQRCATSDGNCASGYHSVAPTSEYIFLIRGCIAVIPSIIGRREPHNTTHPMTLSVTLAQQNDRWHRLTGLRYAASDGNCASDYHSVALISKRAGPRARFASDEGEARGLSTVTPFPARFVSDY